MATYEGIIAGIGDKAANKNVIYPYFDASMRNFIVGKDCILDGLELSQNGLKLTAGHCVGQGFVGELKNDITFTSAPTKIYAHFTINHSDEIDKFDIETYSTETPENNNVNILTTAGEYWVLLYSNKIRKVDRNYPENAVNSDTSEYIIEGGTIAENVIVEGDMKPPETNNKTVATTEWVHEVIKEQIGAATQTINYYVEGVDSAMGTTPIKQQIGKIEITKKADIVIALINTMPTENLRMIRNTITIDGVLDINIRPVDDMQFILPYIYTPDGTEKRGIAIIKLSKEGVFTIEHTWDEDTLHYGYIPMVLSVGWKINL